MTAVAALLEELVDQPDVLTAALVDRLEDDDLVAVLTRRFRGFTRSGHGPVTALLLAVGYEPSDASFIAESLSARLVVQ
jgi:hypothetical protein